MIPQRPVAVTGIGCICAAGENLTTCLESMFAGLGEPRLPSRFTCRQPQLLPVFETQERWISPFIEPGLTLTASLLLCSAKQALSQAGLNLGSEKRVGVVIGTSVGASLDFLDFYRDARAGHEPDLTPIERYVRSNPAVFLSKRLGLNGPAVTLTNACSSGADAIGIGCAWIRLGLCDVVLAGGADALSELSYNGFARLMVASPEPCRPFDLHRKGLNLGEGAAVLVLEPDDGLRDASVYGRVLGYGTCSDAYHLTAPHPEARGLERAVEDCLRRSGLSPDEIGFVNVHGTATLNNDIAEGLLLTKMLPGAFVSATKGFTGHTLGAAGAIETAFVLGCLGIGELPATLGFAEVDPGVGIAPVAVRTQIESRYALSLSLAFGGLNTALAFERGENPCV